MEPVRHCEAAVGWPAPLTHSYTEALVPRASGCLHIQRPSLKEVMELMGSVGWVVNMNEVLLEEEMSKYVGTHLQSQCLGGEERWVTSLKPAWAT